jgi:mRNA interferase RelE/StbE
MHKIELSATAYKWFKNPKAPGSDIKAVKDRILSLGNDPRPAGCDKIKGMTGSYYRVRQGNYRVVYEVDDRAGRVVIVSIGHRRDIYRKL